MGEQSGSRRRWGRRGLWGVLGVVVGAAATLAVLDAATAHHALAEASSSSLGQVIGRFLLSPGFGGAAAVFAAALAYRATTRTRADAKAQAVADRNNALDDRDVDRWWEMYRLVYEDAPGLGQNGATLALEALGEMAHTDDQDSFLVVLTERLLPTDDVVEEEP